MKMQIIDTTLRDGEQTPGVAFSVDAKAEIAKALDDLGVDVIEVGIPVMGKEEFKAIQKVAALGLNAKMLTWNRLNIKDIDAALITGVKNMHISVPSSRIQIEKKLGKTPEEVLLLADKIIGYACGKGCFVSVGAEDASRADMSFLIRLYDVALKAGAKRIRYADTLGILSPFQTIEIIKNIHEALNADIDFHGHNDFGMATANALAAYKGGAKYISCSINGLGERAGNTALEEIIMALYYMENIETNIRYNKLVSVSRLVEDYSGRPVGAGKAIVGEEVFSHESGIHVDGLIKDVSNYQYLDPNILGRAHRFVHGKHSGKAAKNMKELF